MVNIENKNILSDWRDIVRNGSDSNGILKSFLKIYSRKKDEHDKSRIIHITRMSVIFVMPLLCLSKNLPAFGKAEGLFLLAM